MTTTSDQPATDRKAAILAAALAVFSEKGIAAATIDDIRHASQASVGSIYHHFGTKEGIAAALFAQGLDDYWRKLIAGIAAAPTAERAICALVGTHVTWITSRPDLARFLFARRQAVSPEHEQAMRARTAGYFKMAMDQMKPWFKQGVLRRLPPELYGPLLLGPAQELARNWLGGRTTLDPQAAVAELAGAAWRSLATDPTQHGTPKANT